ncbi:hypothetical protein ACRCUN_06070 [Mycobacterium sp. LTG2003]
MSTTSIQPSTWQWFRRLLSGQPHQVIGGLDDPYLLRWYVIPRNPLFNVYLHQFLRSDDDRALHDHPWWFVSLILRGHYDEVTERGTNRRRAGSIAFRPAEWRHRVALIHELVLHQRSGRMLPAAEPTPCWTLIVTGRRVRTWGFWCKQQPQQPIDIDLRAAGVRIAAPDRLIPWDEFGDAGCGEA